MQHLSQTESQDMESLLQKRLRQLHLEHGRSILSIVGALTNGIIICAPLNAAVNVASEIISMAQVGSTLPQSMTEQTNLHYDC
jgi:hypothetical protein